MTKNVFNFENGDNVVNINNTLGTKDLKQFHTCNLIWLFKCTNDAINQSILGPISLSFSDDRYPSVSFKSVAIIVMEFCNQFHQQISDQLGHRKQYLLHLNFSNGHLVDAIASIEHGQLAKGLVISQKLKVSEIGPLPSQSKLGVLVCHFYLVEYFLAPDQFVLS